MGRKSVGTIPPWMNLKEALAVVKFLYEKGGGSVTHDDLARWMGYSVKSSSYKMRMVAMRAYGLAETDSTAVRVSLLAREIVAPSSQEEYHTALLRAFNSQPLLSTIYQRYKGGFLPEDSFLGNTLERDHKVSPKHKSQWVECFKESGRAAGVLQDEGGKIRVLQSPIQLPKPKTEEAPRLPQDQILGEASKPKPPPTTKIDSQDAFPVVLDEKRSVIVPMEFSREDLEYLQGVLELYVKRRESKKEH